LNSQIHHDMVLHALLWAAEAYARDDALHGDGRVLPGLADITRQAHPPYAPRAALCVALVFGWTMLHSGGTRGCQKRAQSGREAACTAEAKQ
jgi:hypothetical protein